MNAAIVIQRRDRDAGPVAAATFAQLPVFIFEVAVAHGLRQFNVAADTVVRIKHRKMPTGDITAAIAGALLRTKVPSDDIAFRIEQADRAVLDPLYQNAEYRKVHRQGKERTVEV